MPGDDVVWGTTRGLAMVALATFIGGWLAVIIGFVLLAVSDLPADLVAFGVPALWLVGAAIFAVIMGRRMHADRERAKRDADQASHS
jgi:hypothetical protein